MKISNKLYLIPLSVLIFLTLISVVGAQPFAYIPNDYSNSVSVIDTTTDNATAVISVGGSPFGVACAPDGTKVYITSISGNSVSIIDTATNNVTAIINVGKQPEGIIVSPDGKKAYVANTGSNTVSVIDTSTNKVTATVNVGKSPYGITVTPDGSKVYVANNWGYSISVINTATNQVISTISAMGFKPTRIFCNPNGNAVYVTCSARVMVIDPNTNTIVKNIGTGGTPIGVTTNPDGTRVYVTNSNYDGSGSAVVIDASTYSIISKIVVDKTPWGISVTPDGSKVYVTSIVTGRATVINTTTNTVIQSVQTGGYPASLGQFIIDIPVVPSIESPVASFSADHIYGKDRLEVEFTDASSGNPTSWKWDFGDGGTSSIQSPVHIYETSGVYTVSLTVANPAGNDTMIKTDYINVN